MNTRKLVTIRTIDAIEPIPGADSIECLKIGGWSVVAKKGDFQPGDQCIYFEIDSFLPIQDARFSFLKNPTSFNGHSGFRIKTIKLRGQVSQGIALPLNQFPEVNGLDSSMDLSTILGVMKWEAPIPVSLSGQLKGPFPSFCPKTDQERFENISEDVLSRLDDRYEITVKLDGTSMTIYHMDGNVGVCGRNWEFQLFQGNGSLVDLALKKGFLDVLKDTGRNIAIQGELMGPGIQKNREGLSEHQFFVFDVIDLNTRSYFTAEERHSLVKSLGMDHVPVLMMDVPLKHIGTTKDDVLSFAHGKSLNHPVREGLVYKKMDGKFSFKTISTRFLLSE